MGASPNPVPGSPVLPVEPPAVNLPATPPPDSTSGASKGAIRDALDAMLAEPDHPDPGRPESEATPALKPAAPPAPKQKAAEPVEPTEPAEAAVPESAGPPSEAEFPEDEKKVASPFDDDELLFEDERDSEEAEPEVKAKADADAGTEQSEDDKAAAKESRADAKLDDLLARRKELTAKGVTDKKLDDDIRGAFLSKNRGKRMLESDDYRIEIQEAFGELPPVDQLKSQRRAQESLADMAEDFHSGDPQRMERFFGYWLTPVSDPQKGPQLRPGADAAIASLPYFLATNQATAPVWQQHVVPRVATYIADGLYARAKQASNDLDKRGMFATAQWLDQVFLGKARANSIEDTPTQKTNGRSQPDPEMQRILAERDQMKQQLETNHLQARESALASVSDASEDLVGRDIDFAFKDLKEQLPARAYKALRADVIRDIAGELANDQDFSRSFERGFNSAFAQGDREAIDRLPKLYRDKARAFIKKNYKAYRAELKPSNGNGSKAPSAAQTVEESKQRHEKHAKAQERKAPGGGKTVPTVRMAPIGDMREGEKAKDYLLRELGA